MSIRTAPQDSAEYDTRPIGSQSPRQTTFAVRNWSGVLLVLLATVCWSTGGVFLSTIAQHSHIAPLNLAFWRVLSTFLILLVSLALWRPRLLRIVRRDLPWLAGLGALAMGSFQALWIMSVLTNGLSVATVIQCNAPILVTVLAWLLWREELTWPKWVAIGLSLIGTLLLANPAGLVRAPVTALGFLVALGSALAYGAITLFAKKLSGEYQQWTILVYAFGFASLALLPFQFGGPVVAGIDLASALAFVALLLVTTIGGYALYWSGLKRLQASVASILAMAEIPLAALWGYALLGERLNTGQVLGALAVVSGVLFLSLRRGVNGQKG